MNFCFLPHSCNLISSFEAGNKIVTEFKDWIENNGGWEVIQDFRSNKREKLIQRIIHLCAKKFILDNDLDFSCEPNNGHGPADFKISRGNDKTVIELKLSSNPQYLHGYETQIRLYAEAEKTTKMIYILINVGNDKRIKNLEQKTHEESLKYGNVPEVYIINAKSQLSASIN